MKRKCCNTRFDTRHLKNNINKIVIFEDSQEAIDRFKSKFEFANVEIISFRNPLLNDEIIEKISKFSPHLIVVDLILGGFKDDGYNIISELQGNKIFRLIPIIVCSKLINDSDIGKKEKRECMELSGVKAAFSKFPDYPDAEEFLKIIKMDSK